MKLADLLISSAGCTVFGSADKDVEDLIYHSDKAASGSVFFAIEGQLTDGREYIEKAVEAGRIGRSSFRAPSSGDIRESYGDRNPGRKKNYGADERRVLRSSV